MRIARLVLNVILNTCKFLDKAVKLKHTVTFPPTRWTKVSCKKTINSPRKRIKTTTSYMKTMSVTKTVIWPLMYLIFPSKTLKFMQTKEIDLARPVYTKTIQTIWLKTTKYMRRWTDWSVLSNLLIHVSLSFCPEKIAVFGQIFCTRFGVDFFSKRSGWSLTYRTSKNYLLLVRSHKAQKIMVKHLIPGMAIASHRWFSSILNCYGEKLRCDFAMRCKVE